MQQKPKILLVGINACFNHTNIAIRSIAQFIKRYDIVFFDEWTINQNESEILRGIFQYEPNMILFSTYVWNIFVIKSLIPNIKRVLPNAIIGCGGPETSFCAEKYLLEIEGLDFIVKGEGEVTVKEIVFAFEQELQVNPLENDLDFLSKIPGVYFFNNRKVSFSGERQLLCNLDELSFPYQTIQEPDTKIYYYESSRGCPFSCAYCMSSLEKKVRFLSLQRVFTDLQKFLDANVKLVKFVDRTYNLNEERYIAIWKYIVSHHNNKTMFHFEIEAEFLSKNALEFLQTVPKGVMQFEIGVQSCNEQTLKTVGRSTNVKKLFENVRELPNTIHKHLDLIAGLPYEDLISFGQSFERTISLKPDELQLGFLKVLHGTQMEEYSKINGWKWMVNPPYETFSTPFMSYQDILFLKDLEILLDQYYNSGLFRKSVDYVGETFGYWNFFFELTKFAQNKKIFLVQHRSIFWFDFFVEAIRYIFSESKIDRIVLMELLRFDFISSNKKSNFPSWYKRNYDKTLHRDALENNGGVSNSRIDFAFSDFEVFCINPLEHDYKIKGEFRFLFYYKNPYDKKENTQILL